MSGYVPTSSSATTTASASCQTTTRAEDVRGRSPKLCGCLIGQSLETQRSSQDCGDRFGSGSLADVVSGEVSMAPDSAAGVMSARAILVGARVCIPFAIFVVSMVGVRALMGFTPLVLRLTFKGDG